jgi:hypothetical protein
MIVRFDGYLELNASARFLSCGGDKESIGVAACIRLAAALAVGAWHCFS